MMYEHNTQLYMDKYTWIYTQYFNKHRNG